MRVLMALPDQRVRGGPPVHLYLLCEALCALDVDVRTFIYGGRTHDEGAVWKVLSRCVDLVYLPALLLRHRPDVVQLNSAFDRKGVLRDMFFVSVARLLGQRVVLKFHGSDLNLLESRHPLWRVLMNIVVRGATVVCVLSREEAAAFTRHYSYVWLQVVKNALDLSRYTCQNDFRGRYHIPSHKPLLLFVARFIATKGLREVIQALPIIRQRQDVHAVFVGDGPVREENETLVRTLRLEGCTTFTGYLPEDETVGAYQTSTMLVFPTYHQEGMPMVIFHALACGLPIITTRIRAAADWLEEGKHCLFVPARDPQRLAQAVLWLLDNASMRQQMGQHGRALAQRFEMTTVAHEFIDLYGAVVRHNGRGNRRVL
jgi:glycosyltransferase involved in cell wall biosynthesis